MFRVGEGSGEHVYDRFTDEHVYNSEELSTLSITSSDKSLYKSRTATTEGWKSVQKVRINLFVQ